MKLRRTTAFVARVVFLLTAICLGAAGGVQGQITFGEQNYPYEPSDALPGATEFVRKGTTWEAYGPGENGPRTLLGVVFLTDDFVNIPGYSGHTLNTLMGLDRQGKITGVKIVRHSEPIVLIGLSEKVIHDFVAQYVGKDIRDRVVISDTPKAGYVAVDGISGATVTAVAENAAILEAGRQVGRGAGILKASEVRRRRPSERFEALSWGDLAARGAVGEMTVRPGDLGQTGEAPLVDLKFAVLDPASIGRNLLGERYYAVVKERVRERGSALFIGGNGTVSFKGAGFARGGIFDRFGVEQEGRLFVFKDVDYLQFTTPQAEGAPTFQEGGIFFVEGGFNPAEAFTFHLTVPYRVGDRRAYGAFVADYRLPGAFAEEEAPFWMASWQGRALEVAGFAAFLVLVAALFALRQRLVAHRKLIHRLVALVAAAWVGVWLKAQPSTTQVLTLADSAARFRLPFGTFLSEPLIFLFWVVIAVSIPLWGRGFFCGWLCPYGALLEVLLGLRERVLPERLRRRIDAWAPGPAWRAGKYVTFLILLGVGFFNLPLAETLDEVEPFKTFILRLARPAHFVAYFVAVTVLSVVVYRSFCRFLCPLGGALSIPSRRPLLPLARYDQCSTCKICHRGCEPKAISYETGRIDYRECLQCWDCQKTGQDEAVCPALIVAKRERTAPRLMAGALLLGLAIWPSVSVAGTRVVTSGPGAIREAIAASAEGDTLLVTAGVYRENVVVNRRIAIVGVEGAVVDAGGKGHVLAVEAPGVTVEGLTLRGGGCEPNRSDAGIRAEQVASGVRLIRNRVEGCRFGIWIHGSEGAEVVGNRIDGRGDLPVNARGDGVHLWSAQGATIRGNTISDSRDGVYMELSMDCRVIGNTITRSRYSAHTMWCDRGVFNDNTVVENLVGLALMFSKQIEASRNVLHNNATHGLLLIQVTRSRAVENLIIGNTKGLFLYNSLYNTLRGNLVARNNLGMHCWGGSEENEVTDNAFVQNEIQVNFVAAHDQAWDGNFWSDYLGWDLDGNGRGDAPYLSNSLVDALLWKYPAAKLLLTSPALQALARAEREFPVIAFPKGVDRSPRMSPAVSGWASVLERYPPRPQNYYGEQSKLPHIPGE